MEHSVNAAESEERGDELSCAFGHIYPECVFRSIHLPARREPVEGCRDVVHKEN